MKLEKPPLIPKISRQIRSEQMNTEADKKTEEIVNIAVEKNSQFWILLNFNIY